MENAIVLQKSIRENEIFIDAQKRFLPVLEKCMPAESSQKILIRLVELVYQISHRSE